MKRQILSLFFLQAFFLSAAPVQAGDFIAARTAYIEFRFEEAARLFMELAQEGDHRGQSFMGRMYGQGLGVPQDARESLLWYQAAAEQGNGYSANQMALAYLAGRGVPRDPVRAEMWFTIAIQRGFGWADRVKLEQNLTREQILRGRQMAGDYMKEHNLTYKTKK
jgi:TPR repeat protein